MEQRPRQRITNWLVTHWRRIAGDLFLLASLLAAVFGLLALFLRSTLPSPLYYPTRVHVDDRAVATSRELWVTTLRCYQEPLPLPTLVFTVERRLVDARTDFSLPLQGGQVSALPGCNASTYMVQTLPPGVPAGLYYIEGLAHVEGRWGEQADVYWRSDDFEVTN